MNSRSVSDNLVNFSTELATTLNQLDSKEPLLSFPFDHLYACHSESTDRRQTLHLDKEVEISTHCVVPQQEKHVTQRLASLESQNKKLKDLLIYHLDLIQQQNDLMSKREKVYQALKQENDTLKSRATTPHAIAERKVSFGRHPPPLVHVPVTATVTSSSYKSDVASSQQQAFFNSFNELLLQEDSGQLPSPYLYNSDLGSTKPLGETFDLVRTSDTVADLQSFLTSELGVVPSILEGSTLSNETFTMIDQAKRSKREPTHQKPIEVCNEPKYTVTTSSGNPKIQRNRKRPTGIGSFSRMPKAKTAAKPEKSTVYNEDLFSVNKHTNVTYGKSNQPTKANPNPSKYGYTALQERLQLIDPTPTGEDPYQIGEAEMREQSPIPKLMLQKTNHGRMRICSDTHSGVTSTITSTTPTRRIYDTMSTTTTSSSRNKRVKPTDRYSASNMHVQSKKDSANIALEDEPELDVEKTDGDIDWRLFTTNKPKETSLCDFSYGETSANLVNIPLDITKMEFPDFFEPGPVNADSSGATEIETAPEKNATEKTKKRGVRTTSLAGPPGEESFLDTATKRGSESKRGRKRALSTAAKLKRGDNTQPKAPAKPRARRAIRGKKTPVPGMMTKELYHTCMGDPDLSWYLGLDPDIKKEDCDPTENTTSNVEVPRWREKTYASLYSLEGTENLDDKVFEKRHQKLEAEERRQLRWHMRRIREQRHVERLRQRQRDPWGPSATQPHPRSDYTVWPQPVRDLEFIEITDTLPVTAFGEEVPDLPQKNFMLPWVRTSKALKRSKRSKTLH